MRILKLVAIVALLVFASSALAQDDMAPTVGLGGNDELGAFLVDANGMTLYIFTNDEPGVSNCAGDCATAWPPLTVAEDEMPVLAEGISGMLGVIEREDGARQVTYNGWPLYFWQDDAAPGDATGHLVGDVWFVATPPTVGLGGNDELGSFLVGANGFTLYTFANDEAGVSNCAGDCANAWPPVTVASADALTVQPGLSGAFATIEREDGSLQVTYNDMPLYLWVNDAAVGDSTGHLVGDVWFVVKPLSLEARENAEFGSILVGPTGMTLYTFANDEAGVSNCVDRCATNWPPLTVAAGEEPGVGEGVEGEVTVIERADGTLQVAYNGAPLYYWVRDVVPGDTTGHNVGDVWFVAVP